uniref:Uncharacterized protein n=1 Tax=Oryza sativa subsp. japonica TaxID=39947 RepID=Q5Z667_ORYSJ|nr:hypothetical protein [Oryza sativa Japonica Group]
MSTHATCDLEAELLHGDGEEAASFLMKENMPPMVSRCRWSEMEAARGGAVRGRQGRSGARARGRGGRSCIMFIEAEYDDNSASTVDICRLTGNNDEHHAEAFKRLIPPRA